MTLRVAQNRRFLAVALIVVLARAAPATANLTNLCYLDETSAPWFQAKKDVPIYFVNSGPNSVNAITGLSDWDISVGIKRATTIWNEYGGASIKLRYAGTTTNDYIGGAVVLVGNTDPCMATPDCQNSPNNCAPSQTIVSYDPFHLLWLGAQVQIIKSFEGPSGCCFDTTGMWGTGLGVTDDLVGILVHELGHAVFNIGHPGDGVRWPSCRDGDIDSVMNGTSPVRTITHWDREIVQQRYGVRSQYSYFYHNRMLSDTSWKGAIQVPYVVSPLYRMGSMSNNLTPPLLGWIHGGSAVTPGGAGQFEEAGRYSHQSIATNQQALAFSTVGGPVAVAAKGTIFTNNDAIYAYMKFVSDAGSTVYTDDRAEICYHQSADSGATWGPEICTDGQGISEVTPFTGLTAAYDSYSNTFLIAFVRTDGFMNDINILTVPATGSSVPSRFSQLYITTLHAPSIACTGASHRCLVAYEGTNGNGSLTGTFVGVDPNGYVYQYDTWSWALPFYDTPGLAYKSDDDTFRLALTDSNAYVYSYKMSNADPTMTWIGTGDIWNNQLSQVSTAIIGIRSFGITKRDYGWFIKYW